MKSISSKIPLSDIRAFLKKYHKLIFWMIWGMCMSLFYGNIFQDFTTGFMIFGGFGTFMGLTMQFVSILSLRRTAVFLCVLIAVGIVWKPWISFIQRTLNQKISSQLLVDDVRQLASILEDTHPDPYSRSGGKIAFHRRMQNLIQSIPEDGLTKTEFYCHLCPFMAAFGDGHTSFWEPYHLDSQSPGGIPFYFQVVDDLFYVFGVIDSAHHHLIGSKLISVENVSIDELLARQSRIKGYDNEYQLMRNLGYDGSLWYKTRMEHLLPVWNGDSISIALMNPDGKEIVLTVPPNTVGLDQLISAPTSITLPSTEKSSYVYRFMDEDKKTAFLVLENMYAYRETFEMEMVLQRSVRKDLAKYLYQKYNDAPPPGSTRELIAGIPSVTELFRDLVIEMKRNKTENLIIDLRENQGGNAFISTILLYFIYGKEALISFNDTKSIFIKKYSPHFWRQYRGWNIDDINKHQLIELTEDDYDFSGYSEKGDTLSREETIRIIEAEAAAAATFWKEYQSEEYAGYFLPKNILLLCSPLTNSSGYAFMYDHWAVGGKVVGIPSSQAGNSCGAWVGFNLRYSGLKGGISHLYVTHFRDDPQMGRTFRPDYELTYADLKSFGFDPNAEIHYSMALIDRLSDTGE